MCRGACRRASVQRDHDAPGEPDPEIGSQVIQMVGHSHVHRFIGSQAGCAKRGAYFVRTRQEFALAEALGCISEQHAKVILD